MTRYVLADGQPKPQSEQKSSASLSDGEQARRLLVENGFPVRYMTPKNGQYEFACPFHEEEGPLPRGVSTNFYLDKTSSKYYCQSTSCGEKGNLTTLQQYFGVDLDPTLKARYKSKDSILTEYQAHLTPERRKIFYDKGLTDLTIDRFRLGWRPALDIPGGTLPEAYVIPYLEGRRPVTFRFYSPTKDGPNGSKYWWERTEDGLHGDDVVRLFNATDGQGDRDGRVYICEGEQKAMLLIQNGRAAVSIPGASTWRPEWAQYFMDARDVIVLMDNDNPDMHHHTPCRKCNTQTLDECAGHNPGQDAASRITEFFGRVRGRNVVLPLPTPDTAKTDINEFIMRDGHSFKDFDSLVNGDDTNSAYFAITLREFRASPPEETVFLVNEGLLPRGGRLLVTGAPKSGKSIFVENLALSIASGMTFLKSSGFAGFTVANDGFVPGHRVLLLDRELSKRSLLDRLDSLERDKPGYSAGEDKLIFNWENSFRLDGDDSAGQLIRLIETNAAEVIILDTAYKFFSGDMENARAVAKAFATLDECIVQTGVSVVLTHHHRKGTQQNGRESLPHPDQVMGSFLWTGWPNGTVLLNFKDRRVESPFNTIASFVAFRDAAPPDPLLLMRSKESISYNSITPYSFVDGEDPMQAFTQPVHADVIGYEALADTLAEMCPTNQEAFLFAASAIFGVSQNTVKLHLADVLDRHPDFERVGKDTRTSPLVLKYKNDKEEEPYVAGQMELGGTVTDIRDRMKND